MDLTKLTSGQKKIIAFMIFLVVIMVGAHVIQYFPIVAVCASLTLIMILVKLK